MRIVLHYGGKVRRAVIRSGTTVKGILKKLNLWRRVIPGRTKTSFANAKSTIQQGTRVEGKPNEEIAIHMQ